MKNLQFLMIFISALTFSQNDMKARIEYEDAETAFASGDYNKAVVNLTEAEKLLGKWTPKVGYLLIVSLDKVMDYGTLDSSELQTLNSQIKKYMQYASKTKDIDIGKFREISTIEKYVNSANAKWEDSEGKSAMEYFQKNEYQKSFEYFKKSADKGNIVAMGYLAWHYANGNGVEKNLEEALKLYKIPAERKISFTMNNLGMEYYNQKKYTEAKKWFEKAAMKGVNSAMCSLAIIYYFGYEVDKNYDKALDWYEKALDKDYVPHPYNMQFIGELYYRKKDYTKSMRWYKETYEKGSHEQKNIAKGWIEKMYEEGLGVERNKKLAREWRNK